MGDSGEGLMVDMRSSKLVKQWKMTVVSRLRLVRKRRRRRLRQKQQSKRRHVKRKQQKLDSRRKKLKPEQMPKPKQRLKQVPKTRQAEQPAPSFNTVMIEQKFDMNRGFVVPAPTQ